MIENNVLLDELPNEWNGYQINTWFQIGVQMMLLSEDEDMADEEKMFSMIHLLFENEDGSLREYPIGEDLEACIHWFLCGWNHDRSKKDTSKDRLFDFNVDQWRIYADFRQIYGINLNDADLHYWEFMGLLWNMPFEKSSFLHVIEVRKMKPKKDDSHERKREIAELKECYELESAAITYTKEEEDRIDEYDRRMAAAREERKKWKSEKDHQLVEEFMKYANTE